MFNNIPTEMQAFNQWVCWRYEALDAIKPTKVPYSALTGRKASVTDSQTWCSFDQAVNAAQGGWYSGIGFVLTENDPFAFIDLDDTKGDKALLDRQMEIYQSFDSYAERSPSGTGLHIIVKGSIPSGRKRKFTEVYSSSRYMTMTGDVYRDHPIVDCNEQLNNLWEQLGGSNESASIYLGLADEKEPDSTIIERAANAANGEKFNDLYQGNWQNYYSSQSEADLALINIIAFYTQSRIQIVRIFRASALGQREKAQRQDYVNFMLNKCFDNILPPVDVEGLRDQLNAAIEAKQKIEAVSVSNPVAKQIKLESKKSIYSVPPGLVGEIAQFIYAQAPRQVAEIALVGALGIMSGICGRAYNVSGIGLNQFIFLLAPTGTGKEAISTGMDKLFNEICKTVPAAIEFIGPGEISSAQAAIKYMNNGPTSFVTLSGEFGLYLQQMVGVNAPPHMKGFKRFLLDTYMKSGEGKVVRPSIWSDKDKNTQSILSPAFSVMGESTPETFYSSLTEELIADGLLPRFTIIEYNGKRMHLNDHAQSARPSFELTEKLASLCAHALMLNNQNKAVQIGFDADAFKYLRDYDIHCTDQINGVEEGVVKHLWNRAHLKALKLSGLIAVGCNPYNPQITMEFAEWAVNLVTDNVRSMLMRFNAGEIGIDNEETKQLQVVIDSIRDYILLPWSDVEKYAGSPSCHLHSNKILAYSYLQRRLASVAVFRKDKMGGTFAIKRALKTLCERGDIQELSKVVSNRDYKTNANCFAITNYKIFGFEI